MRALSATALSLAVAALTVTTASAAIPVDVRVEGVSRTVFEGPVVSDVRLVRASSDGSARKCDGTNNGANPSPSPTATSVTADALALQGQDFDARWYPGLDEYLITRLGPEPNSAWGLYRGDQRAPVGGCQLAVQANDRVLWAAGTAGGATGVLRIAVTGANPYDVSATDETGAPVAGATIYDASAAGTLSSTGAVTDGAGRARLTLAAGYHRLKAGKSGLVRSARAVVCVEPCGAPPSDVLPRTVPSAATSGVKVSRASFSRSGHRRGLIRLSWRLTRKGAGMKSWALAADDLTTPARAFRVRARGRSATSASLRLPAGRTYALRLTWTDRLLRPGQADFGRVLVPIDDRAKAVTRRGAWRKARSSKAWKGTILRGRRGARLKVKLPAGRSALALRGSRKAMLRIGSKRVRVAAGRRTVLGPERRKAGAVTITVMRGSIDLDGIAASP